MTERAATARGMKENPAAWALAAAACAALLAGAALWREWRFAQSSGAREALAVAGTLAAEISGEDLRQMRILGASTESWRAASQRLVHLQKRYGFSDGALSVVVVSPAETLEVLMTSSGEAAALRAYQPAEQEEGILARARRTRRPAVSAPHAGAAGRQIAAYAPYLTESGDVAGFVRLAAPAAAKHDPAAYAPPAVFGSFAVFLSFSLARRLRRGGFGSAAPDVEHVLRRAAEGHLSARLPEDSASGKAGTLAVSFNAVMEKFKGVVERARLAARGVETAAGKQSRSAERLAEEAARQAQALARVREITEAAGREFKQVDADVSESSHHAEEASSAITELTSSIEHVDETAETLARSVTQMSASMEEMSATSKQMVASVDDLARVTTDAFASVQEISSSIEEVRANATDSMNLSRDTASRAEAAGASAQETIKGMHQIELAVQDSAKIIRRLGEHSDKIGDILNIINDIADQTNLLALNASIIAAQAGEHGRGFAVVSEEIRELAERTGASTREIGDLITAVQSESQDAVASMDVGLDAVSKGSALTRRSAEALDRIVGDIRQTDAMIARITRAATAQAENSAKVTRAMEHVSQQVREINRAIREQDAGRKQIFETTERLRLLSERLKGATREQTQGSRSLSNSLATFAERLQKLQRLARAQAERASEAQALVHAAEKAAQEHLSLAEEMRQTVRHLGEETKDLSAGLAAYGG